MNNIKQNVRKGKGNGKSLTKVKYTLSILQI